MLAHLATAFLVGVIALNLVALALLAYRATGDYVLSRVATPAAAALALFFCEHFVGLGRLGWIWPLTTALSVWVVARQLAVLRTHWKLEVTFLASFAWVFAWRFTSPGIVPSSEKIGDLAMIASYRSGTRLPPQDAWFPPFPFDVYYSFQHYAAALLGRLFALGPGVTYNLAFCFLVALTLTAAAAGAYIICGSRRGAALVATAFAVGGTGASIPVHFMMSAPPLHSSMRFIGGAATTSQVQTAFGRWIVNASGAPDSTVLQLPVETFAYLTQLGDYHPPLAGFYLLALALLCIARLETAAQSRIAQAVLAATVPVCAIANGWSFPFQGMLVATWVLYRVATHRAPDWRALGIGAVGAGALCYPFLSTFAYRASDYDVHLRMVARGEHTPALLGAIVLGPVLAAVVLPWFVREERTRWLPWASLLWFALLMLSEFCFIDDVYSGPYNRFNTTLKWWPWIQAGALLTVGAYGMRAASRIFRCATVVILLSVTWYGVDMGRNFVERPKPDAGELDGASAITSDAIERPLLEYLKAQPAGIVLQRPQAGAFTPAPAMVLLAGQTAFLGWAEHEKLWRGMRADVAIRADEVKRFYAGELPDAASWLVQNHIDHVLWLKTEAELPAGTFDLVDRQIGPAYFWREYYRVGDFRVGVWTIKAER